MNASTHLEHATLNHFFRGETAPAPTAHFLALYISDPTDDDIGTEISVGGYIRQPITFTEPVQVNGKGTISNNTQISFPEATERYPEVSHWGVRDAETGGVLLAHAPMAVSRPIEIGDEAKINIGKIVIAID